MINVLVNLVCCYSLMLSNLQLLMRRPSLIIISFFRAHRSLILKTVQLLYLQ